MFKDINFRYTDAAEEKLYAPELLKDSFVDISGILSEISKPGIYLVYGPKGSGKTALSAKLDLESKEQWDKFAESDDLEQFEFKLLDKIGGDKATQSTGAVTAWEAILLIRIFAIINKNVALGQLNPCINKFVIELEKYGFSPSTNLVNVIEQTTKRGIYSQIKTIIASIRGEKSEELKYNIKDTAGLLDSMFTLLEGIQPSGASYTLILDGLDYPLRKSRSNLPYLADLINAVRLLNAKLSTLNIQAKVIILARTEILQITPDPNLAKRMNDNGAELRWYENTREPIETSLLGIIERRAAMVGINKPISELIKLWFPDRINSSNTLTFILDKTRFLPRDLISFFRELQKLSNEPPFTTKIILSALSNYSDWFISELSDSLVGIVKEEVRLSIPDILSSLGREFEYSQLCEALRANGVQTESEFAQISKDLYNTSWIGNTWKNPDGAPRYSWKHRKKNSTLNLDKRIIVHNGLLKTLNLV